MNLRIGFMGTPDFAIPALQRLIQEFGVCVVYTKEPKARDRGQKVQKTPIHRLAEKNNIEVRTPKSLRKKKEEIEYLKSLDLDYLVVCAYGLILPQSVLDVPKKGCINIHGSLLPRWRGAAPLQHSIMAGDDKTGITIMHMDAGLDTGDMLLKGELLINNDTTADRLHDDMAKLGGDLIVGYLKNPTNPEKQDDQYATYANKIEKEDGFLDFQTMSAKEILLKYNALSIWPGVSFEYKGQRIKVKDLELIDNVSGEKGQIISKDMIIACTDNQGIKLNKLQKPGKGSIMGSDFLNGEHDLKINDILK